MPNTARQFDALPPAPKPEDLAECARRKITYGQLLAERNHSQNRPTAKSRAHNAVAEPRGETASDYAPNYSGTIPVRIVLPWSTLVTDNKRHGVRGEYIGTTKEYRLAKQKAVEAIETQIGDLLPGWLLAAGYQPLFRDPVAITVVLIEPNRTTKRDLLNYQKLICDAMKGVVYADDSLIDDAHFTRGTPDIDRPRAEITVTPIGAKP